MKRVSEVTVPKSPGTTEHTLPGTTCLLGLGEEPRVREHEGQVLPLPQLLAEQLATKKSTGARPGSQLTGLTAPWAPSTLSHQAQAQDKNGGC